MCRRHTPLQKFREACQIARDHGMHVIEQKVRNRNGLRTVFVLYRDLPDGRSTRLGARSTVDGVRALVVRCSGSPNH